MRSHLRRCPACGVYTLKSSCVSCNTATRVAVPARFSPEDHYGVYRRRLKRETEREGGKSRAEVERWGGNADRGGGIGG